MAAHDVGHVTTTNTSRVRGPWSPSTRSSSMLEVADGPETSGGVLGTMISAQNLAIGAAAVGLAGKEGDIFRRVPF